MPIVKPSEISDFRAFSQHGFFKQQETSDQVFGRCPFCGRDRKFYISKVTSQWDCKACGHSGGTQMFLQQMSDHCQQHFRGEAAKALSDNRGISIETLRRNKLGYNPSTKQYTIPVPYAEGDDNKLLDLRHGGLGLPLQSTAGCTLGMLGWRDIKQEVIWLCEGEWDKMAVEDGIKTKDEACVSVPGANTFKGDWVRLFADKIVYACYDCDEAGEAGAKRAFNSLSSVVRGMKFVHWPKGTDDGHDMRDEWKERRKESREHILKLLKPNPPGVNLADVQAQEQIKAPQGKGLFAIDVYEQFTKWLYLPDTVLLDVIFGTVIANRSEGDPLWIFLIAPPGGTKTEPLLSLSGAYDVVCKSTLGAKSLVSGQVSQIGVEPSLLPRLHNKTLIVKDFTTILGMSSWERDEITSILRDAYDGKFERDYGNGKLIKWNTHFGIIAGVTPAIERLFSESASFGERFVSYHIPLAEGIRGRRPYLKKARGNVGKEVEMKAALLKTATETLNFDFSKIEVDISSSTEDMLIDRAQFTSVMRGTVTRDRMTKDVTHSSYSELGTRLVKQYTKMLVGISKFHRSAVPTLRALEAVRRVAIGSAPTERRKVIEFLYKIKRLAPTAEVAEAVNLPACPTCDRVLHDLALLGAVVRDNTGFGGKYMWRIAEEFAESIDGGQIFKTHLQEGDAK